jgi:Domain of unknown function (DUF4352)
MRFSPLITAALAVCLLACSNADKTEAPHTYQMGERVTVGHMIYTVFERQWHTEFGSGPDARLPQNRFYLLRISVVNSGGNEAIIPKTELIDDSGVSYPESADGEGVQDWIGNTRQVPPSDAAQGYILFDVPPKHYKLKVLGEEEKQLALVDIPLTFDSDVPDVTTPLDPDKIPTKK